MKRRRKLVDPGGREVYEIRIVRFIGETGEQFTVLDITMPGPDDEMPPKHDVYGAMWTGFQLVDETYAPLEEPSQ